MVHGVKQLSTHTLVVQWLRLHSPNAGGLGLIPGQGTVNRSCMLQLRPGAALPTPQIKHNSTKGVA